ncbi:MAG: hypothetical protein JXB07_00945 [Anaerolineae bacterium]|nr:hypothetical protein [Anaerolineae bacterium]
MTLAFLPPYRPLTWPTIIERLAAIAIDPARLYLVGGPVRDALRGRPIHDIDLVTLDDGLDVARYLADRVKGAYYPVDPERRTGRVILREADGQTVIDVASLRGADLSADLQARDFTINAMAVQLDRLDALIDPLGGQHDLFDAKILRQCHLKSIAADPIRALRAVRQSLQLGLRMEDATKEAAHAAGIALIDEKGKLSQPERTRDELFKLLALPQPGSALRLLHRLDLLDRLIPEGKPPGINDMEIRTATVDALGRLLTIISPVRDDNTAADLTLGVSVMILDRYRQQMQTHLGQTFADGRLRSTLVVLGATLSHEDNSAMWGARLCLSRAEIHALDGMWQARRFGLMSFPNLTDRVIYRYFYNIAEAGIDGLLLSLAEYMASHRPTPDPQTWGKLLEEIVAPPLEAYFNRYQQVVDPLPLLNGSDLQDALGLAPGPRLGRMLRLLREEQAAGELRDKAEALAFARQLIN